jgi:Flp pilus assembly protein TadD
VNTVAIDVAGECRMLEKRNPALTGPIWVAVALVAVLGGSIAAIVHSSNSVPSDERLARMSLSSLLDLARRHPASERAYFALGRTLRREGRVFEAVTAFEQAATNDSHSARSLEEVGVTLAAAGQKEDAASYFTWCLRLDSGRLSARRSLGFLYRSSGDWARAAEQLRIVDSEAPGDPETLFMLGESLERCGKRQEALVDLQSAAGLAPEGAPYLPALQRSLQRVLRSVP